MVDIAQHRVIDAVFFTVALSHFEDKKRVAVGLVVDVVFVSLPLPYPIGEIARQAFDQIHGFGAAERFEFDFLEIGQP